MKTLKIWIRNLFGFSRTEINGFLVLLPLMLITIFAVPIYSTWVAHREDDFSEDAKVLDSLVAFWDYEAKPETPTRLAADLFLFDPNVASQTDLQRLGFTAVLSKRIANYRQKGGEFRVKSDLLRIYGVDSTFYIRLHKYILLPETLEKHYPEKHFTKKNRPQRSAVTAFDLNIADTSQLKSVYGIGPVLALRIIKFRDGLGGFVYEHQLQEVYGLDSVAAKRLQAVAYIDEHFSPTRIDINQADEKVLASHPYITRSLAAAIVAYRFQHGNFKQMNDLQNIRNLKPADLERLMPYLTVGQ